MEVVKPFMHVGTYPTRNFATLEPSRLRLPVVWAIGLFPFTKTPLHLIKPVAGFRHYFSVLHVIQRPVFLLNSRSHIFSATRLTSYRLVGAVNSTVYPEVTQLFCLVPFTIVYENLTLLMLIHQWRL